MRRQEQTSDVQLQIGKSRDSGFNASLCPGMTLVDPDPLARRQHDP
jgi:hypothetical protein